MFGKYCHYYHDIPSFLSLWHLLLNYFIFKAVNHIPARLFSSHFTKPAYLLNDKVHLRLFYFFFMDY